MYGKANHSLHFIIPFSCNFSTLWTYGLPIHIVDIIGLALSMFMINSEENKFGFS